MAWSYPLRPISNSLRVFALVALCAVGVAEPADLSGARVYMQPEEARVQLFPKAVRFESVVHSLSLQAKETLVETLGRPFAEETLAVDLAYDKDGELLGYAVISEEIGKFRPITFIVGIDTEMTVLGAGVLVYRESHGGQVRQSRFLRQYVGKRSVDPIRINRDIVNISGATLSVRALNFGVRKVLALTEHFYRPSQSAMH